MNPVPDIYRILPEVILTITGVLVMLADASLAPARSRRGLGWVAAIGTTVALWASLWQLSLPVGTGFSETVETSPFTVFFHVLICGIVLVTLLLSLDTLPEHSHHQGEYYALITFGAVGMCLMTSAIELLVVFIALEISSISTYILAGYRKQTGRGPESAIKYFLLGSFATAFLLYGIAMVFGATGTTSVYEIARSASTAQNQSLVHAALALMLVGILFKVSAAPFHVWTPDVYEGAPSPVVALMSTAPKAAAFAFLLRIVYEMFPTLRAFWSPVLWLVAALSMTVGNLAALRQQNVKRMLAYSSIAHAGYLLAAFAAFGTSGIAAASFYTAAYAAMNVGIFAVVTLAGGYNDEKPLIQDYKGLIYRSPLLGSLLIFFLVSLVNRSASVRAAVRVLSASLRAAEMVRSACSCAAVSIRSACSRASARTRSDSWCASARCLAMSSSALFFWSFASSSASLRICAIRSLTSSCAGLPESACWRTVESSRRRCSESSRDRESRCSSSRISLLRRATKSSTWRRL